MWLLVVGCFMFFKAPRTFCIITTCLLFSSLRQMSDYACSLIGIYGKHPPCPLQWRGPTSFVVFSCREYKMDEYRTSWHWRQVPCILRSECFTLSALVLMNLSKLDCLQGRLAVLWLFCCRCFCWVMSFCFCQGWWSSVHIILLLDWSYCWSSVHLCHFC